MYWWGQRLEQRLGGFRTASPRFARVLNIGAPAWQFIFDTASTHTRMSRYLYVHEPGRAPRAQGESPACRRAKIVAIEAVVNSLT